MKITQIAAGLARLEHQQPDRQPGERRHRPQQADDRRRHRVERSVKRPIMKPSGMPTSAARPKPMPTRCSDDQDVPADALVVRALAVERIAEDLDRRAEGLRSATGSRCCSSSRRCAQRPMSSARPRSGGSTLQPQARASRRLRGACDRRASFAAARSAGRRDDADAHGARLAPALARRGSGSRRRVVRSGEWNTALTMVVLLDQAALPLRVDLEAVGVLLRILAVPDDAVDQLRRAHRVLRHRRLGRRGGLLVDVDLVDLSARPRGSPDPP